MHTELRPNIDWVGFVDWNVRDFHSYTTTRGATYNSYLVRDEKTALIDAVKAPYVETLLANVRELVDLASIRYVVCNHAEPDHSGGLPAVVRACPNAEVICDEKCRETLSLHYDTANWKWKTVKTGDTLSLGKRTLSFIETPMVHWPDSMFTYIPEEKILFSMDAFGQHYATNRRFDDQIDLAEALSEAKKYYANIVMLYGPRIAKLLEAAKDIPLEIVAPSHGVIWRKHIADIVGAYAKWVTCKPVAKVLAIYDTMWGTTEAMARAIVEGASLPGVEAKVLAIRSNDMTDLVTDVLDAACVAVGSSTLNQGMMPMAAAFLTYLKGLKPQGKAGFAFGSFGWGVGGPEAVDAVLHEMKFDVVRPVLKNKYRPTPACLDECRAAGKLLGETALRLAKG